MLTSDVRVRQCPRAMSNNIPFFFGAGGGQPPPAPSTQQHQHKSRDPRSQSAPHPQGTAVQQAFIQNAQLPGTDMSALAGISPEQLAAIARMFQSGALTLPPPPPRAPAQVAASAASSNLPVAQAPTGQGTNGSNATSAQEQDVNVDGDGGELEEGEVGDTPAQGAFLRPPPTGPRNRSNSPRGPPGLRKPSPRVPPAQQAVQKQMMKSGQSQLRQAPQTNGLSNGQRVVTKDESSKMLILEIVKAGHTYEEIAKEISHTKPLRRIFKELGLPISSDQSSNQSGWSNATTASHAPPAPPVAKALPIEEPRKASATTRPAPPAAKPAVVDRSEYLARLQAAKSKKTDASAPATLEPVPSNKPVAPAVHSTKAPMSTREGAVQSSIKPSLAGKAVVNTELVRQKLEALKAEQAARLNGTLPPSNGTSISSPATRPVLLPDINRHAISSPSQSGLGAGLAEIATRTAQTIAQPSPFRPTPVQTASAPTQQVFSPTPPTPNRSFSGLPGLFMGGGTSAQASPVSGSQPPLPAPQMSSQTIPISSAVQVQRSAVPASSQAPMAATVMIPPAPLAIPRKRAVAADFDDTASSKPTPAKRPFGQSRGASEDESLIIHNSDSDSDDEEDLDDAQPAIGQTRSLRGVPPLRDFPPRPGFHMQGSAPSTPGLRIGTPAAAAAYEERLKHIEEHEKYIEEMKRKIAEKEKEKEKRTKAAATNKPTGLLVVASGAEASTPGPGTSVLGTPDAKSTPKPVSAAALARLQEKEKLTQRLAELEDAERERAKATAPAALPNEIEEEPEPVPTVPGSLSQKKGLALNGQVASALNGLQGTEEGELGDDGDDEDSMTSDFYEQQDEGVPVATALVDDGKIGSQATTASATSELDVEVEGAEMERVDTAQVDASVALNSPLPDAVAEEDAMDEDSYDPVAIAHLQGEARPQMGEDGMVTPESSDEGSEEGEIEEDNEDDEDEAMDESSEDEEEPEPAAVRIDEGIEDVADVSDGDESSEASSTDSEDWLDPVTEPEPMTRESVFVENDDVADDHLAPELQPSKEELAESSHEVRGDFDCLGAD